VDFSQQNPKVFAMALLVHSAPPSRKQAMQLFQYFKYTDHLVDVGIENLLSLNPKISPVLTGELSNVEGEGDEESPECKHTEEADFFHFLPWTATSFKTFFDHQWSFKVPRILGDVFEYHFREASSFHSRAKNLVLWTEVNKESEDILVKSS
jgi:hypothetical protein